MFFLDELLKKYLLQWLTIESPLFFYLNLYWNQLALYLLLCPLQWLHIVHLLFNTHWDQYCAFTKIFVSLYVACCLILWECVRIALYHTIRAIIMSDGNQSVLVGGNPQSAPNLAANLQELPPLRMVTGGTQSNETLVLSSRIDDDTGYDYYKMLMTEKKVKSVSQYKH